MECVNCSQLFNMVNRVPRLLTNCGHTICETCLMQFWNHQEYIYVCRSCSTLNKAETLSLFPKNQAILSLTQFSSSSNQNFFKQSHNTSSYGQLELLPQRDFANQSIQSANQSISFGNISHNQSQQQQQFFYQNASCNQQVHQISMSQNGGQVNRLSVNGQINNLNTSCNNGQLKGVQLQLVTNNDLLYDANSKDNSSLNKDNCCASHNKQFEAYCLEDKQFLCIQCILDSNSYHKNHKIETIEKAVQIEMQDILHFQQLLESKKKDNSDTLQKIESLKQEIQAQEQKDSESISQFYAQIFQLIKERQQSFAERLQQEKSSRTEQLEDIRLSVIQYLQKVQEFDATKHKLDESAHTLSYKQYLQKVQEVQSFKSQLILTQEQTDQLKKNSKLFGQHTTWSFQFNKQLELSAINKMLDYNQINSLSLEYTPINANNNNNNNNNKPFTLSLSKERSNLSLPNTTNSNQNNNNNNNSGGSNGKKKSQINISNIACSNVSKKQNIYHATRNAKNGMNESYNNTSLQHDHSLNIIEKEKENPLHSQQQQQQRKHSKTLQATTLNTLIQATPTNQQNNSYQINAQNVMVNSTQQPQQVNQIDFSKYKIEITNIKMINRQASQPKKNVTNQVDIPTYKKENINTLNIITSHQNQVDKQTKDVLYLENRSNKNLLSNKSSANQSTKNVNSLKYKSLRSQNPCNITSLTNNLQGNDRGNNSSSIDKMKILRGSTTETVKNATRHTHSVNNQFTNKPIQLANINTEACQSNLFNERDLQTTRTIESNKYIDFDTERNIVDTVKIDFSSLASQKRQFILIIGGFTEKQQQSSCMEKLDLQNIAWEPYSVQGNMKQRVKFGSVVYKQKKVIVFGGKQEGRRIDTFEEIDIQSKECKLFPGIRLTKPKSGFAFTQISDDEIVVVGGNDGHNILNDVELYNLNTKQIKKLSPLLFGRDELAVALSNDKKYIYAFGGYSQSMKSSLNVVEKYDIQKNKWEIVKNMNSSRRSLQAITLPDGFYILGGFDGSNYLNSVEKYDDVNEQWITIQSMLTPRATFSAIKSPDNMGIIVLGGFNNQPIQTCEKFSIFKGTWESFPSLSQKRFMHSCILYCNNSNLYY